MRFNKKLSILAVSSAFLLSILALPIAGAQNDGGSGLQISPTRTEVSGQPGDRKDFSITIKNVTQGTVSAKATVNDFESDGFSGTPSIIVDDTRENTPYSIKSMIQGLADISLKAGETKEVKFSVDIPGNVSPGAYFGAIRYSAVPEGQQATGDRTVALTASVAHLVFVEVPGDVVQQIKLENLEAQIDNKKASMFKSPKQVAVSVKNLGNGFARPFGKITVNRGNKEVASIDVNNTNPRGIVLPNSSRVFSGDIGALKVPGKYKISAGVAYGNGGEVVELQSSFWYLPLWFIAVLVLVILAIIFGAYYLYKKAGVGKVSKKSKK